MSCPNCPRCNSYNPLWIAKCTHCGAVFCINCLRDWSYVNGKVQCPVCHEWSWNPICDRR